MMEIPQVGPVANVGKRPRDSDTPFDRGPKGPSVEELIASEVLTAMAKDGAAAQTASGWMSQALAPSAFPPEAGLQTHKMQPLAAALQQQVLTPHQARLPQWSRPEVVLPGVQNQGNIVRSQTPAKLPPPRPAPISLAPSPSTQESKEGGRSALYGRKQLKGHDANFVFYYVLESVDPATAQMVVVGTDPRKTGHYSYHSVVMSHPRLVNAHNKRTVTEHLEQAYNAVHQADKALLARVLSPTPEQAHEISLVAADGEILNPESQLRFADIIFPGKSMAGQAHLQRTDESKGRSRAAIARHACAPSVRAMKPQAPVVYLPEPVVEDTSLLRGWTSWETIKSIGPNGGKQIEFVLVDRTNLQRRVVAVHASEVKPDDRRYVYTTTPQFGGMPLKSRSAAEQWLTRFFFANSTSNSAAAAPEGARAASEGVERGNVKRLTTELTHDEAVAAWVLQEAEPESLELVRGWARVLAQCVSLGDEGQEAGGVRGKLEEQAIAVLGELQCTLVNLAVMEETGIAVVVHKLKGHGHPRISHMATTICAAWQALATRASNLASLAMDVQKSQLQEGQLQQKSKDMEPAAASARVLLP